MTPGCVLTPNRPCGRPRFLPAVAVALTALLLALCAAPSVVAQGEAAPDGAVPIMRVADVRPGMRGYGLTTFKGSMPQRFEIEVLGTLRAWSPQGQIVLITMSGPEIEETGTVAGMSGSPIYIDGKLLGAVSYGFYFCKIPLCGVTPAEEMLVALDIDREAAKTRRAARKAHFRDVVRQRARRVLAQLRKGELRRQGELTQALSRIAAPLGAGQRSRTWGVASMPGPLRAALGGTGATAMAPLPVPLAISGVGAESYAFLAPAMRLGGFFPVQAPAAIGQIDADVAPAPGMPVGAVMVSGDIDISGMGTLTMIDGDRVLAFGHPMDGSGETDYPLALGHVQAIVPSFRFSFRLTSAGRIIGRLTQDRDSAIAGRLGEESLMFPVTVKVKGVRERTFRYKIAPYWQMAPSLTYLATSASVARWEGEGGMFTVKAKSRISLKGREKPIVLAAIDATFYPSAPAFELVWMPLETLVMNPFRDVVVEGVEVEFEVEQGVRLARIESVRAARQEVRPGETVDIIVTLKEWQGGEHHMTIPFRIPPDAQPGTMAEILVCDSWMTRMIQMSMDPGLYDPKDLEGLIEVIESGVPADNLYARGSFTTQGLRYGGERMPRLPSAAINMLAMGVETGMTAPLVEDVETRLETPWVIRGQGQVTVLIKKPAAAGGPAY